MSLQPNPEPNGLTKHHFEKNPIAIGGSWGSGTRIVARLLIEIGYYLGGDLNRANDNLWFTLLFRRPSWLAQATPEEVFRILATFENVMNGNVSLLGQDTLSIIAASIDFMKYEHQAFKRNRFKWVARRLQSIFCFSRRYKVQQQYRGWGWKEPNTHVYLPYLVKQFPKLRYIHVIRHGLDMAYSSNQNQLASWAKQYQLSPSIPDEPEPRATLAYWIAANERAIQVGRDRLKERFYLLNYDRLCHDPVEQVRQLLVWLGTDEDLANELARFVTPPRSIGRYRAQDLRAFSDDELSAVKRLGFQVDVTTSNST